MKTALKWLNRIVSTVLMLLLITVGLLVISTKLSGGEPEIFGTQFKTVLSGSMEPGIQTGSVIAVKAIGDEERNNFKKDDVITFMESEDKLVTHRIVEVNATANGNIYTTKGDNNNAADIDPVLSENVVGVYTGLTIPYLGYIINFAHSPNGSIAFLILPGILLLGYSIFIIWGALRTIDNKNQSAEAK